MTFASLSDRLSPIVVKEVRQGLRSRAFAVLFGLTLAAAMIMAAVAYGAAGHAGWRIDGQHVFFAYFVCLGLVVFVLIPHAAFRSMNRELDEATWQLVAMTGLGARRILRGKVASALVQAVLFASAIGPFLLSSYYLNGIDIPAMLTILGLGVAYHVFLTTVAVSAATDIGSKLARPLLQIGVLGLLVIATFMAFGAAQALLHRSLRIALDADFLLGVGSALWAMLALGYLFLEAAASRLALATESYAAGPRRALLFALAGSIALGAIIWQRSGRDGDVAVVMQAILCLLIAPTGAFFSTEADGLPSRFRQARGRWSLFMPGALRGFRLMIVALAAVTAATLGIALVSRKGTTVLLGISSMPAYVALYVSMTVLIGRGIGGRVLAAPDRMRALFAVLIGFGVGVPMLVELFSGQTFAGKASLHLFNPAVGPPQFCRSDLWAADRGFGLSALALLCAVALVAAIAADRVLARRDRKVNGA